MPPEARLNPGTGWFCKVGKTAWSANKGTLISKFLRKYVNKGRIIRSSVKHALQAGLISGGAVMISELVEVLSPEDRVVEDRYCFKGNCSYA